MSYSLIAVVVFYWIMSTLYCLRWHYRKGNLNYGTFFVSLLISPAVVLILLDDDQQEKKIRKGLENSERESNHRHRRWFRTMSEINRQRLPSFSRTIPPPPPISRIEQARTERDNAIRSAIERTEPPNRRYDNKDFKFLRG